MVIRQFLPEDVDNLRAFSVCYQTEYCEMNDRAQECQFSELYYAALESSLEKQALLLAEEEGELVGWCRACKMDSKLSDMGCIVLSCAVKLEYAKKDEVSERLLLNVLNVLCGMDASVVQMDICKFDKQQVNLLMRLGFSPSGEKSFNISDSSVIRFEKKLC